MSVRDAPELELRSFRRHRLQTAFLHGSDTAREGLLSRSFRTLLLGVLIAALVGIGAGVRGLATSNRPPEGWMDEGRLVVDKQTGGRYLVRGRTLRPLYNYTSLVLATSGSPPQPVEVDHGLIAGSPVGPALGILGAPELPPRLRPPSPWQACAIDGVPTVRLLLGAPELPGEQQEGRRGQGRPPGVVVRRPGDPSTYLVSEGRSFRFASENVRQALILSGTQPRTVPATWLQLLEQGPTLEFIDAHDINARDVERTRRGNPDAVPDILTSSSTGQSYLLTSPGVLHEIQNETSRLLILNAGNPQAVPHNQINARLANLAEPVGYDGVPALPPEPPAAGQPMSCLDMEGRLRSFPLQPPPASLKQVVYAQLPDAAGVPAPSPGALPSTSSTQPPALAATTTTTTTAAAGQQARPDQPPKAEVWEPPNTGELVRPFGVSGEVSAEAPVYLVTGGAAFPIVSDEALRALKYEGAEPTPVPPAWLDLLPKGPALNELKA